jgi:hypothetical protein
LQCAGPPEQFPPRLSVAELFAQQVIQPHDVWVLTACPGFDLLIGVRENHFGFEDGHGSVEDVARLLLE